MSTGDNIPAPLSIDYEDCGVAHRPSQNNFAVVNAKTAIELDMPYKWSIDENVNRVGVQQCRRIHLQGIGITAQQLSAGDCL